MKWHDGKPFTAEDVKFTLELVVDPDFRSGRRAGHDLVRDIKVVSPTEITWRMEKPYAPYPSILAATFIVPKHILEPEADGTLRHSTMRRSARDHSNGSNASPVIISNLPPIQTIMATVLISNG